MASLRCIAAGCNETFTSNHEFSKHFAAAHTTPEPSNIQTCLLDGCQFQYITDTEYLFHRSSVHVNHPRVRETSVMPAGDYTVNDHMHGETASQSFGSQFGGSQPGGSQHGGSQPSHGRPKCFFCSASFLTNDSLARHIDDVHAHEKKAFPCNFLACGRSYTSNKSLREHVLTAHPGHDVPTYTTCQFPGCVFSFTTFVEYQIHFGSTHRSNKDEGSVRSSPVTTTNLPHTPALPAVSTGTRQGNPLLFNCDHSGCEGAFTSKEAFRYHNETTHVAKSGSKVHCDDCKLAWSDGRALANHRRVFHCLHRCNMASCQAEFATAQELDNHVIVQHPYSARAKKAAPRSARTETPQGLFGALHDGQSFDSPSASRQREPTSSVPNIKTADSDIDMDINEDDESSGPSVEDAADSDFQGGFVSEDDADGWEKAFKCPANRCKFEHVTAEGIEKHYMARHKARPFPGAQFLGDPTSSPAMERTSGKKSVGSMARQGSQAVTAFNGPTNQYSSPATPSFVFRPSHDVYSSPTVRPASSASRSRPTKGRATPANRSRAQSRRPMGARSFAKLALFEQSKEGNDLRPTPREQPKNQRWSSDEEDSEAEKANESDSSDEDSDLPAKRFRQVAAVSGAESNKNPDDSEAGMSDGGSDTTSADNSEAAALPPAPTGTAGVNIHRGHIVPGLDFDALMSFPPARGLIDPNANTAKPKNPLVRKAPKPIKDIPMNFTDEPETPHMCFLVRRAKELADIENEKKNPGRKDKRTAKKVRRRLAEFVGRPKRKYEWKTEFKNKSKLYAENGFKGRSRDRGTTLEDEDEEADDLSDSERKGRKAAKINAAGKRGEEVNADETDDGYEE